MKPLTINNGTMCFGFSKISKKKVLSLKILCYGFQKDKKTHLENFTKKWLVCTKYNFVYQIILFF